MKRFRLCRIVEEHLVNLAFGVECERGGMVLLYWVTTKSAGVYPSMDAVEATHCAGSLYSQKLVWIDE